MSIQQPRNISTTIKMSDDMHHALKLYALSHGTKSDSETIYRMMEEELRKFLVKIPEEYKELELKISNAELEISKLSEQDAEEGVDVEKEAIKLHARIAEFQKEQEKISRIVKINQDLFKKLFPVETTPIKETFQETEESN